MINTLLSIFVSYARNDAQAFVDRLAKDLKAQGFDPLIDRHFLKGGDQWRDEVEMRVKRCHVLLIVLSPSALESKYVKMEYRHALELNKLVIPLQYKQCAESEIPMDLRGIQRIDFLGDYQKGLDDLLVVLRYEEGSRENISPGHSNLYRSLTPIQEETSVGIIKRRRVRSFSGKKREFLARVAIVLSIVLIIFGGLLAFRQWLPESALSTPLVRVDNTSSAVQTANTKNLHWNHTIRAYQNRILFIEIVTASITNAVSMVTFKGTSLALLTAKNCPTNCRDEVWYLLNPPTGTYSVSVTTNDVEPIVALAISLYNVDQTIPFGKFVTTDGVGISSNVSVPSRVNQLVIDFYGNQATPDFLPTAGPDQMLHVRNGNKLAQEAASSTRVGNAPDTAMIWTWKHSNDYADIGVPIN